MPNCVDAATQRVGQAYDQITSLWTRSGFDESNGIAQVSRAIAFLPEGAKKVLDVGCGCSTRFIELFESHGLESTGIDVSAKMVELASQQRPDLTFLLQDICQWQVDQKYDFITIWDSLWHIPLAEQEGLLVKLLNHLNPGGVLIFSFGGTDTEDEHTDSSMGPALYYASLGVSQYLDVVREAECQCRHLEYDQPSEQHTYMIVQKDLDMDFRHPYSPN